MFDMNNVIIKKSKPIKFQYLIYIAFHIYSQALIVLSSKIDFFSFRTRSLYDDFSWSYSQNRLSLSKSSYLFILVSMVTLNLTLFFTEILDLIYFHMPQTRSLFHYVSWNYSQNRLNQSKFSISDSIVTIIETCYAVQRFKIDSLRWTWMKIYPFEKCHVTWSSILEFLIYKTISCNQTPKWLVNIFFHPNHL